MIQLPYAIDHIIMCNIDPTVLEVNLQLGKIKESIHSQAATKGIGSTVRLNKTD